VGPLLLLAATLTAAACTRTPDQTRDTATRLGLRKADAVKPVPAELPDVLARVNGDPVTREEFERALQGLEGRAGGPIPADQRDRLYRGVLDQLIAVKLLQQEAAARRIAVADADVDARVEQIRAQFPLPGAFERMLDARKTTLERLRADTRRDLAVARLIEAEAGRAAAVTPQQVGDFYTKNPERFQQKERVRASHILLTLPRDADAATRAQVRARAEDVLAQARSGKAFAALARRYSQDPGSAPNGGDLGYLQRGQMAGPFADAAFSLPVGATSDVIETPLGFHVLRVVERQPARVLPVEEVRPQIEQYLKGLSREARTAEFVASLKSKGNVEILI
jgi:peptidyl-prolyl cis-trans isomerase C